LLVGLVAPVVYDWTWELPQALALVAALALGLALADRAPVRAVVGLACLVGTVAAYVEYRHDIRDRAIEISRNFYGTLRVQATGPDSDPDARWRLLHGVIIHGEQYRDAARRTMPTTYYGETSGVGRAILGLREQAAAEPQRVGLIGLGVGTLAAYGRAGDHYRIYEINPEVIELARKSFTYLPQSPAEIVTPLGDARLVLEREAPQQLHVLAVDAFSSDSIPVHLVTREAMAVYRRHVRDDGAIAFHISNRYLDLSGVVQQLADSVGWSAVSIADDPPESSHLYRTTWVVITRNAALIEALKAAPGAEDIPRPTTRPWTDDFNNLFDVLK
ncbi:MAG: spermidine synthase, partial [Gemmatimonas sp.]